eukprot:PhF_6_TR39647/c0_g1_i2/m.58806
MLKISAPLSAPNSLLLHQPNQQDLTFLHANTIPKTSWVNSISLTTLVGDVVIMGAAMEDGTVEVYDYQSLNLISSHQKHKQTGGGKSVCCVDLCGNTLISCGDDNNAYVSKTCTSSSGCLLELTGHRRAVRCCAISPIKYSVGDDNNALCFQIAVTGGEDGMLKFWDLTSGCCVATYADAHGGTHSIMSVAFSRDGKVLVSGGGDGVVRVWEHWEGYAWGPNDEQRTPVLKNQYSNSVSHIYCLTIFSDHDRVLVGTSREGLYIWNRNSGRMVECSSPLLSYSGDVNCVALTPDNRYVALGIGDHCVVCRVCESGYSLEWVHLCGGKKRMNVISCVSWVEPPNRGGYCLAVGSYDKSISVYEAVDGVICHERTTKSPVVCRTSVYLHSLMFIATGHRDGSIRMWSTSDATPLLVELSSHVIPLTPMAPAVSLVFSSDGRYLAAWFEDGFAKVWTITNEGIQEECYHERIWNPDGGKDMEPLIRFDRKCKGFVLGDVVVFRIVMEDDEDDDEDDEYTEEVPGNENLVEMTEFPDQVHTGPSEPRSTPPLVHVTLSSQEPIPSEVAAQSDKQVITVDVVVDTN